MLRNGAFEFEDIPNGKCLCRHSESEHLINLEGIADCCLFAKGDVCICDKFQDKGSKMQTGQEQKEIGGWTRNKVHSTVVVITTPSIWDKKIGEALMSSQAV